MPFLFLYHGLEIELLLQVCLRFFVFSFSIMYLFEGYKCKWSFFMSVCKPILEQQPGWPGLRFQGVHQPVILSLLWLVNHLCPLCFYTSCIVFWPICKPAVFWFCHLDRWVCWVQLQKGQVSTGYLYTYRDSTGIDWFRLGWRPYGPDAPRPQLMGLLCPILIYGSPVTLIMLGQYGDQGIVCLAQYIYIYIYTHTHTRT